MSMRHTNRPGFRPRSVSAVGVPARSDPHRPAA